MSYDHKINLFYEIRSNLAFSILIQTIKFSKSKKINLNLSQIIPEEIEKVLVKTSEYYFNKYGYSSKLMNIQFSDRYKNEDFNDVLNAAIILNIDLSREIYLMWIPRIFVVIELPEAWTIQNNEGKIEYYNCEEEITINVHPGHYYFSELIKIYREIYLNVDQFKYKKFKDLLSIFI